MTQKHLDGQAKYCLIYLVVFLNIFQSATSGWAVITKEVERNVENEGVSLNMKKKMADVDIIKWFLITMVTLKTPSELGLTTLEKMKEIWHLILNSKTNNVGMLPSSFSSQSDQWSHFHRRYESENQIICFNLFKSWVETQFWLVWSHELTRSLADNERQLIFFMMYLQGYFKAMHKLWVGVHIL